MYLTEGVQLGQEKNSALVSVRVQAELSHSLNLPVSFELFLRHGILYYNFDLFVRPYSQEKITNEPSFDRL